MKQSPQQPAAHIDPAQIASTFPPERAAIFNICGTLIGGLIGSLGVVYGDLDMIRLAVASVGTSDSYWEDLGAKLDQVRAAADPAGD